MMRRSGFVVAIAVSVMAAAAAWAGGSKAATQAEVAAQHWLGLVDTGHYAKSWQQAAPLFRAKVTEAKWATLARSVRVPLGALKAARR